MASTKTGNKMKTKMQSKVPHINEVLERDVDRATSDGNKVP